jgi:multicomponent Na+:H+ antiporter subunit B
MINNLVIKTVTRFLMPIITLYGYYILLHGEDSPGGGFQAGAILGGVSILYCLVFGNDRFQKYIPLDNLLRYCAFGVIIYMLTGIASMLNAGVFLEYNQLYIDDIVGQKIGILAIEIGVALTVWAAISICYLVFSITCRK